jgi:hypothetical protein
MERQHLNQTKKTASKEQPQIQEIALQRATHPVVQLQADIGNQAVNQLLEGQHQPPTQSKPLFKGLSHELVIQPKLAIGAVGDKYEQEADRVAEQVVSQMNVSENSAIQRQEMLKVDDNPQLKMKPVVQCQSEESMVATPEIETTIQQARGSGQALSDTIRQPMERSLGSDFSQVRIHTDDRANRLNESIQAKAFTTGQDIFFKHGEYNPGNRQKQKLIAHELTHVVQQNSATVQRNLIQRNPKLSDSEKKAVNSLKAKIPNNQAAQKIYKDNERLLTLDEITAIETLSSSRQGQKWLYDKGFLPNYEVEKYAEGKSFTDWSERTYKHKIQIATYQYNNGLTNTPGYWKALSVYKQTAEIYEMDTQKWADTLEIPEEKKKHESEKSEDEKSIDKYRQKTAYAIEIVKRVFLILQAGLQWSNENKDWGDNLSEWTKPVAVALSHGGRVNIRIPKVKSQGKEHEFIDWLLGTQSNKIQYSLAKFSGVTTRAVSTHNINIKDNKSKLNYLPFRKKITQNEKKTKVKENSSKLGYWSFMSEIIHYGLNLPIGGLGKQDINGDVILPDGRYGHLYLGYVPPTTKKDGGLLIGLESDAYGAPGPNPFGHEHTKRAKEAEFSPTGGLKGDKIGSKEGGRKVDLTKMGDNWLDQLKQFEQNVKNGRITSRQLFGHRLAELNLLDQLEEESKHEEKSEQDYKISDEYFQDSDQYEDSVNLLDQLEKESKHEEKYQYEETESQHIEKSQHEDEDLDKDKSIKL